MWSKCKSGNHYKYLGIVLGAELADDKDIHTVNIVQETSCMLLFPDVQMQLKMYFFVPSVCPCITIMVQFQEVMHAEIACGL